MKKAFPATESVRRPTIPLDRWILNLTAIFGCSGFAALTIATPFVGWQRGVSALVYGATLAASCVASMVYNKRFRHAMGTRVADFWRLADHIAIFLLIAGTYTPFALLGLVDGGILLAIVWGLAIVGTILKLIFRFGHRTLFAAFYVAMGWVIVFGADRLFTDIETIPLALLVAGGVAYTTGVAFYLRTSWYWYSAVWHGFVLTASVLHYAAVWFMIVPTA